MRYRCMRTKGGYRYSLGAGTERVLAQLHQHTNGGLLDLGRGTRDGDALLGGLRHRLVGDLHAGTSGLLCILDDGSGLTDDGADSGTVNEVLEGSGGLWVRGDIVGVVLLVALGSRSNEAV